MKIKISPEAKKLKNGLIKATNMTSEEKKKDFQKLLDDPSSIFNKNNGKIIGTRLFTKL